MRAEEAGTAGNEYAFLKVHVGTLGVDDPFRVASRILPSISGRPASIIRRLADDAA